MADTKLQQQPRALRFLGPQGEVVLLMVDDGTDTIKVGDEEGNGFPMDREMAQQTCDFLIEWLVRTK